MSHFVTLYCCRRIDVLPGFPIDPCRRCGQMPGTQPQIVNELESSTTSPPTPDTFLDDIVRFQEIYKKEASSKPIHINVDTTISYVEVTQDHNIIGRGPTLFHALQDALANVRNNKTY